MPYLEAVLVGGWQAEGWWWGGRGDHAYGWLEEGSMGTQAYRCAELFH